eukprot:10215147-Alexandrium_andersonii.AAC.1
MQFQFRTPEAISRVRQGRLRIGADCSSAANGRRMHPPGVDPTAFPNSASAKVERRPAFHMDEAAIPGGPAGRNILAQLLESADGGGPLGFGAACPGRHASRGPPGAQSCN